MENASARLHFASDYMEGAHPAVLARLVETNLERTPGYGADDYCRAARDKIRAACACPGAAVHFLVGGTQTNATVIDACLRSWQGVVAADTGHISTHEAGAVELCGHKVLTLPQRDGKLAAEDVRALAQAWREDENREHTVMPGMVYLSQPTEYGTLYTRAELAAISGVCRAFDLKLYVDGARLAYALASPVNDVTLADLAALCDVFYIGGTKCGALFGEAVVAPDPQTLPRFFTVMKQHGALLAKGRLLGLQFDALFTDGLYLEAGRAALACAARLRAALLEKGCWLAIDSPTNQLFVILENERYEALCRRVECSFWERPDPGHTVARLATSWATRMEEVEALIALL